MPSATYVRRPGGGYIEIQDKGVTAAMNKLARAVTDLSPILAAIGAALVASTKLRFEAGQAPDGSAWAPLSPVTRALRRKGKGGGSDKPLLDTGRLRNSISWALDGQRAVVVGTNVVYARTQQFGARKGSFGSFSGRPIPWGDVPARPFLGVSTDDRDEILETIRSAIGRAAP